MDLDDASNHSFCAPQYEFDDFGRDGKTNIEWFACHQTKQCIHSNTRCDLHPNPACIYQKGDQMVAADEEGCLEEYKKKRLLGRSANYECQSFFHNPDSLPILATVRNMSSDEDVPNVTVIARGTIVHILATKCNGVKECWNGIDEDNCGFDTYISFLMGM